LTREKAIHTRSRIYWFPLLDKQQKFSMRSAIDQRKREREDARVRKREKVSEREREKREQDIEREREKKSERGN